jgi:hypothetical protein
MSGWKKAKAIFQKQNEEKYFLNAKNEKDDQVKKTDSGCKIQFCTFDVKT